MPADKRRCSVKISDGVLGTRECERECLPEDEACVCHSKNPNKDRVLFQKEVDEQLAREDLHDFAAFEFPSDFSFTGMTFGVDADFRNARFYGKTDFQNATFASEIGFNSVRFHGEVDFTRCRLTEKARVVFDGHGGQERMFGDEAHFRSLRIDERAKLTFSKVTLDNCRFLETDLTRVNFEDVIWPLKEPRGTRSQTVGLLLWRQLRSWLVYDREVVYDEQVADVQWLKWKRGGMVDGTPEPPKYQYRLIAQLYRRLQSNYVEGYRYREAGAFHIGEQEVLQAAKSRPWRYLSAGFIYRTISNYGESFRRPLAWLALVLLLFPAIFLWGGIAAPAGEGSTQVTTYSFSLNPLDCLLARSDYWQIFSDNVSFLAFNRERLSNQLPHSYQHMLAGIEILMVVTLITFFLLALRRQFNRKSF